MSNHTTFVHWCVPSLAKSPLPPFVKGGAQGTGDLSLQIMCTNLVRSDLAWRTLYVKRTTSTSSRVVKTLTWPRAHRYSSARRAVRDPESVLHACSEGSNMTSLIGKRLEVRVKSGIVGPSGCWTYDVTKSKPYERREKRPEGSTPLDSPRDQRDKAQKWLIR